MIIYPQCYKNYYNYKKDINFIYKTNHCIYYYNYQTTFKAICINCQSVLNPDNYSHRSSNFKQKFGNISVSLYPTTWKLYY